MIFFCLSVSHLFSAIIDLSIFEKGLYSKHGEDGIISKIFQCMSKESKTYVEIGSGNGVIKSNISLLRLQGWKGVSFDRLQERGEIGLYKEFITRENISDLLRDYGVSKEIGVLSIRLKYNSYHIWDGIDSKYRPAVVVVRYNKDYSSEEDQVVKYRPFFCGSPHCEFGAGIFSFRRLGAEKGYTLVYVETSLENLFFIRNDLIDKYQLGFKSVSSN